eukprot:4684262-Pyramimonas_sp.AAC.1
MSDRRRRRAFRFESAFGSFGSSSGRFVSECPNEPPDPLRTPSGPPPDPPLDAIRFRFGGATNVRTFEYLRRRTQTFGSSHVMSIYVT